MRVREKDQDQEKEKEKKEKKRKRNQPINLCHATQSLYPEETSKLLDRREKVPFHVIIILSLPSSSSLEAFGG